MRILMPLAGAGWRGLAGTRHQAKARSRLSDAWWVICDPAHSLVTYRFENAGAEATLAVSGTIGETELQLEVAFDPALIMPPPRSLVLTGSGATVKRAVIRRRITGAPDDVRRLRCAGGLLTERLELPIDEAESTAIAALARAANDAGETLWLALSFAAGTIDLRLGETWFEGAPTASSPGIVPDERDDEDFAAQIDRLVAHELPRRLLDRTNAKDWPAVDALGANVMELSIALARAAALVSRGRTLRGAHDAAVEPLALAARLQPRNAELRASLGLALIRGGDPDRGIAELTAALEGGAPGRFRVDLARALWRRARDRRDGARAATDREQAIALLRDVEEGSRDAAQRLMLADLLYEKRAYTDCLSTLTASATEHELVAAELMLRARALVALDRIEESFEPARRVLALEPDHAGAAFHLRTLRHFAGVAPRAALPPLIVTRESRPNLAQAEKVGLFDGGSGYREIIDDLAGKYRALGFDPVIVAFDKEPAIRTTAAALRDYLIEHGFDILHAVGDAVRIAIEAAEDCDTRLIFGIGRNLADAAIDDDRMGFERILARADALYADSPGVRDALEWRFGVRTPIMSGMADIGRDELSRLVAAARAPVAVAIGSGLGNLIHAGPTIRRIAAYLGHRVDLIVAEDYDDSLALLHDPAVVGSVFSLRAPVLDRRWSLLFVTNSFGVNRLRFAADRIVWCRDWDVFRADHELHEAIFNLEAARALIGMDYKPADAALGCIDRGEHIVEQATPLVGLHAGSKTGVWACKRWPLFAELARALTAQGFSVASFGLRDEYVPGTIDLTGGTIADMTRSLQRCAAFVANDSGVMNLANGIGVPVLALFAPTAWRTRGPLGGAARSLALEKDCSPCETRDIQTFRTGVCRCISELSLELVIAAFHDLWANRERPRATNGVPRRA